MATVIKTIKRKVPKRKALRGVIREIRKGIPRSLIYVENHQHNKELTCELPDKELAMLNLNIGDLVSIFPVNLKTCIIVSNPQ